MKFACRIEIYEDSTDYLVKFSYSESSSVQEPRKVIEVLQMAVEQYQVKRVEVLETKGKL